MATFAVLTLHPGGVISWVVVGLIAGWLATRVMGTGYGMLGDILLGLVGAFIGGLIVGAFASGTVGVVGSILVACLGAILLIGLSRLFLPSRTRARA